MTVCIQLASSGHEECLTEVGRYNTKNRYGTCNPGCVLTDLGLSGDCVTFNSGDLQGAVSRPLLTTSTGQLKATKATVHATWHNKAQIAMFIALDWMGGG